MSTLLVSTRKGLLVYDINGTNVRLTGQHFLGDPVSNCTVDAAGHWYAALNLGHFGPKVRKSEDRGKTWSEMACPAFEATADSSEDNSKAPQVSQLMVLEAIPEKPGHILAGTIPGAIFKTENGAESWQINAALWGVPQREKWFGAGYDDSGVHSIALYPGEPHRWTAAISVGGVWHTDDDGGSWAVKCAGMKADYMPEDMSGNDELQDPHRLVQSPSNPQRMWVQHHCGIFVSDDFGRNWRECFVNGHSSFGFAVVVHPHQPDTAWFVPAIKDESRYPIDAKLQVLRTDDGGHTFASLTKGLPQQDCYDLIYRHAFDIDSTGEMLVMGSTTGNLWLSQTGGEQWQTVSHTLPPVYAVKLLVD